MKLKDILFSVGSSVIKSVVPGGGVVLDLINNLLPNDKKLGQKTTGEEAIAAIESLPAEQKASLMEKQLDVEIAEINNWSKIQASLASADIAGSSTRPEIAVMMSQVVSFTIIVFISILAVAIIQKQEGMIKVISELWPLMLAILGLPIGLLRSYFGMRSKEKKSRYQAASVAMGQPQMNIFADIVKAVRGKH